MSDIDSAFSTPAPVLHRPSKRRRVYDASEASSPRSTSADELNEENPNSHNGEIDHEDIHYKDHDRSPSDGSNTPHSSQSPDRARSPPTYKPLDIHFKQKAILRGHKKGVAQVRFSPDGKWIASCSADATIKIWDATTALHVRTLQGHLAGISTIAWSPDSDTLASGSDDKGIRLWDRETGKPYPAPLLGHHNYVYSVAFSPKGNLLASGSYDEAVFIWDLRARRQMRSLPAHSDPVGGVDFVRDGTMICSCSTDGLIRVWDSATGQCLRTIVHEDNAPVTTVRFTPNGRYILASTLDSCIRLWDYVSGTCKKTYQGHLNAKYSIGGAIGVTGKEAYVVSGSEDGDIVFWDITSKEIIQRISGKDDGHDGVITWVDACPGDSGKIVSGGLDGTVRLWVDVNNQNIREAYSLVPRPRSRENTYGGDPESMEDLEDPKEELSREHEDKSDMDYHGHAEYERDSLKQAGEQIMESTHHQLSPTPDKMEED